MNRRVIKVGGSLLDLPDLPQRIQNWLKTIEPCQNILLMGGGNFCNELRVLHQRYNLSESTSHELCMHQMVVTSRLLSELMQLEIANTIDSIESSDHDLVFDCQLWLAGRHSVPKTWDVTSDSIGALLAAELQCEYYLLKSVDTKAVDEFFPMAAKDVCRVSFVNLR